MDDIDYCKIAVLTLLAVCAVFLPASSYFTKSHVTYFAAADQLVQHQVATLGSAQTVGQDPVARPVWHAIHRNQMPTPHRSTDSSTGPHEGVGLAPASAALLVTGDASVDGAYTNVLIGSLLMAFGAFGVAVAFWRMGSLFASCGAAMGVLCPLTVPISTPSERLAAAAITGLQTRAAVTITGHPRPPPVAPIPFGPARARALPPLHMVRNIDTPEALIFYGVRTVFAADNALRRGVARLVAEAAEVGTRCILLTEQTPGADAEALLAACAAPDLPQDLYVFAAAQPAWHAPNPGALISATEAVEVQPEGFGGSHGFGKRPPEQPRPPLPKHCVVFVQGARSRRRCVAARQAGMRVLCVESPEGEEAEDEEADDVADAVIDSLGEPEDWDGYGGVVTLMDVATPGSYWLNPPVPRDENSNAVNPRELMEAVVPAEPGPAVQEQEELAPAEDAEEELTAEELAVLADMDIAPRRRPRP